MAGVLTATTSPHMANGQTEPPMRIAAPAASGAQRSGPDFNRDGYADLVVVGSHYATGADLQHWVVSSSTGRPEV